MSAFFVSRTTINDCVETLKPASMTKDDDATLFGVALWKLNIDAMISRYPSIAGGDEHKAMLAEAMDYKYEQLKADEAQQLKSLNCWLYQCAEGDVDQDVIYKRAEKHAETLTELLSKGRQTLRFGEYHPFVPGYDEAAWDRT